MIEKGYANLFKKCHNSKEIVDHADHWHQRNGKSLSKDRGRDDSEDEEESDEVKISLANYPAGTTMLLNLEVPKE